MTAGIVISPLLPLPFIVVLATVGLILVVVALLRGASGTMIRFAVLAVLVLSLVNPRSVHEERQKQPDIGLIVVDRSASQAVEQRPAQTDQALAWLRAKLSHFDSLEMRTVEVRDRTAAVSNDRGTQLFTAINRGAGDIPRQRFAGAIVITDGQAHDHAAAAIPSGPVHVLLTGRPGETDRRLVVEQAPSYGIVGTEVSIVYRVEDRRAKGKTGFGTDLTRVVFSDGEREIARAQIPIGRSDKFTFTIDHAGPTVLQLEFDAVENELSTINNRALVNVNGVRDRLRVLLVSGKPHAGERTWRNLLKSDPSVDLVHFTILRPPEKDDFTPLNELALISFPVRELFNIKLREFDLVVFDRYLVRDILPPSYMRNIDNYVREGGALLLALGSEFSGVRSLFHTPLGQVMPAAPTGRVLERGFRPRLTTVGRRHPVTTELLAVAGSGDQPRWGRWFRQIEATVRSGITVLRGPGDTPLLVLDRVESGRVAQMLSDHIWLWARGFEGGGPHAELLRRLSHWLMKEPDLEEESLRAAVRGGKLIVKRRSLEDAPSEVTVTSPSGKRQVYVLETEADKLAVEAEETGLYRISDGARTALAVAGPLNPLEFSDLRATAEHLSQPIVASGGGLHWIIDGLPEFRRTRPGRDSAGKGWIGLVENHASVVTGITQTQLLPAFVFLPAMLLGLMVAWWREGR